MPSTSNLLLAALLASAAPLQLDPVISHPGSPAPELGRLLMPADRSGAYQVYQSDSSIEEVSAWYRSRNPAPSKASWTVTVTDASTLFGETVHFKSSRLIRLYGGIGPKVARGPVVWGGRTLEAVTLISPRPDPSFRTLHRGTLIVVVKLGA